MFTEGRLKRLIFKKKYTNAKTQFASVRFICPRYYLDDSVDRTQTEKGMETLLNDNGKQCLLRFTLLVTETISLSEKQIAGCFTFT